MKRLFTAGCFVLFCLLVQAQQVAQESAKPKQQVNLDELKGTYELKYLSRSLSLLPSNLAELIELNRKEAEVTVLRLNENVEVVIFPRNKISANRTKNKE